MTTTTGWKCWRDPNHEVVDHPEFGWPQCVRSECRAAPPYHERLDYLPDGYTLDVFVPRRTAALSIFAPGSAIIGTPLDKDHVKVYYEGFVYGTPNEARDKGPRAKWVLGIQIATERCITAYPTVATAFMQRAHLLQIGSYEPKRQRLLVHNDIVLDRWVGIQSV